MLVSNSNQWNRALGIIEFVRIHGALLAREGKTGNV